MPVSGARGAGGPAPTVAPCMGWKGTAPRLLPLPSLSSATRDYALSVETGYVDRLRPRDREVLAVIMGPEIWAWQYARRLVGQPPWRAGQNVPEVFERARALREMMRDLDLWERAVAARDAQAERAGLGGGSAPLALDVPEEVLRAIAARRAAARERDRRRRGRTSTGVSVPTPEETIHPPPGPTPGP